MQELVTHTDLTPMAIKDAIERLKGQYDKIDSAIEIAEKGELWKMGVKSEHSNLINKLATGRSEFSKAEQETLAIIAYKQPIKQSVVIKIRGNKAYEHIKKFADVGLLKKKKMGHTWELSLSEEFHDYFSLKDRTEIEGETKEETAEEKIGGENQLKEELKEV